MSTPFTLQDLRTDLMSPVAFDRVKALHALERAAEQVADKGVAREILAFTARGIPYYCLDDAHYKSWVAQAQAHWGRATQPETQAA